MSPQLSDYQERKILIANATSPSQFRVAVEPLATERTLQRSSEIRTSVSGASAAASTDDGSSGQISTSATCESLQHLNRGHQVNPAEASNLSPNEQSLKQHGGPPSCKVTTSNSPHINRDILQETNNVNVHKHKLRTFSNTNRSKYRQQQPHQSCIDPRQYMPTGADACRVHMNSQPSQQLYNQRPEWSQGNYFPLQQQYWNTNTQPFQHDAEHLAWNHGNSAPHHFANFCEQNPYPSNNGHRERDNNARREAGGRGNIHNYRCNGHQWRSGFPHEQRQQPPPGMLERLAGYFGRWSFF